MQAITPVILSPPINLLLTASSNPASSSPAKEREHANSLLLASTFTPHLITYASSQSDYGMDGGEREIEASDSAAPSSPPLTRLSVSSPAPTLIDFRAHLHEHPSSNLHSECINDIILTDVEGETLSASTDKTIVQYSWRNRGIDRWTNHTKAVEKLAYSPRLKLLFSGSRDSTIRSWRSHTFKELSSYRGHSLPVTALLLGVGSAGQTTLLSGSRDYSVRMWDVESGTQVAMKALVHNVVTCMRWMSPSPAAGGGEASFHSVAEAYSTLSSPLSAAIDSSHASSSPAASALSLVGGGSDFNCFLQGSEDCSHGVRLWDARCMDVVAVFPTPQGKSPLCVDADPKDANYFVASTTGKQQQQSGSWLSGSGSGEVGVASIANSVEAGGEIRVWDRRKASSNVAIGGEEHGVEPVLSVLAHADSIHSVAYLPAANNSTATFIATASKDRTLKIWDLSSCTSASSSFSSSSFPIRCTQVVTYRDPKQRDPFTAMVVSNNLSSEATLSAFGANYYTNNNNNNNNNANQTQPTSSNGAAYVLYTGTNQGVLSAWKWNPNQASQLGKLELIAQTKPVSGH